ncbi:DUF4387 domain-containing protein [Halorarius litoreus]|uniref:DUF4387 domain-containing protein n=1 Tax=Halorarius litoreus TaxID=2962676 RepID=UPI0020CD7DD4|nr:DUF4387 domain-containing protein [Halorarius litoreus]
MRLGDLADVVRSKNAGIHYITVDVMFRDRATFEAVRDAGVLSAATVADRYGLATEDVRFFVYEPGLAFKATLPREHVAGSPGDPDLYGAQQHAPLLDVEVPVEEAPAGTDSTDP